ncbi:MAG TPA: hypothetical protein VH370_20535 [Humisphaera sp.]|jgi:hypothetical protein|nr:hypothetical protein [Humisphaera sp.]
MPTLPAAAAPPQHVDASQVQIGPDAYSVVFEQSDRIADHDKRVIFIPPGLPPEAMPLAIAKAVSAAWADRLAAFARCLTSQWQIFSRALEAIENDIGEITEDEADVFAMIVKLRRLGVRFDSQFLLQMGEASADMIGRESFIDDDEDQNLVEHEINMTEAEQSSDDEPGFPSTESYYHSDRERESTGRWKLDHKRRETQPDRRHGGIRRKVQPLFIERPDDLVDRSCDEHGEAADGLIEHETNCDESMHEDCDEHGELDDHQIDLHGETEWMQIPLEWPAWNGPRNPEEAMQCATEKTQLLDAIGNFIKRVAPVHEAAMEQAKRDYEAFGAKVEQRQQQAATNAKQRKRARLRQQEAVNAVEREKQSERFAKERDSTKRRAALKRFAVKEAEVRS